MEFHLITIEGVVFAGTATQVIIPTTAGQITVLPRHIPLISELAKGEVIVTLENEKKTFEITGGVLEVRKSNNIVLLADSATEK